MLFFNLPFTVFYVNVFWPEATEKLFISLPEDVTSALPKLLFILPPWLLHASFSCLCATVLISD